VHRPAGLLLLLGRQLFELRVAQDLAVADRRDREAVRRADETDVLAPSLLLQRFERAPVAILELLVDLRDTVAVMLALERRGDGLVELLDEPLHVAAQHRRAAGREPQRHRLALVVEIVDVAPVGGLRRLGRAGAQELLDDRVPVASGRAEHEDVEAVLPDPHAEIEGLDGSVLADREARIVELLGGREAEGGRVAVSVQGFGTKPPGAQGIPWIPLPWIPFRWILLRWILRHALSSMPPAGRGLDGAGGV